jgi:glycosyltransferase involved in cell wall biosynthesis
MTPLRIAIVVHGRFHAFDLARALLERGHDVTVFTNYPGWAAARFGVPARHVRSAWVHGAVTRTLPHVAGAHATARHEAWLHRSFGRWAARALEARGWDVIHGWSGISEEWLASDRVHARTTMLMRGSAHIEVQDTLLREEEARTGTPLDRPSEWMIARERREYERADRVVVLSSFARDSFEAQGYPAHRLDVLPLGVDVRAFTPPPAVMDARRARIRAGAPLRVLYAGALSLRKGLYDLAAAARECEGRPIEFRLAGHAMPEAERLLASVGANVVRLGKFDQSALPPVYWDADLFFFPTIEDGFGMVLTQARAAGLPVLCTTNCAGPDLIRDGLDGWIVPIRRPDLCADRLTAIEADRAALLAMIEPTTPHAKTPDWSEIARQFEELARHAMRAAPEERPA